jgi:hypothetical protein
VREHHKYFRSINFEGISYQIPQNVISPSANRYHLLSVMNFQLFSLSPLIKFDSFKYQFEASHLPSCAPIHSRIRVSRRAPEAVQRVMLLGGVVSGSGVGGRTKDLPQYGRTINVRIVARRAPVNYRRRHHHHHYTQMNLIEVKRNFRPQVHHHHH